jgi:hypothetical protein
MTLSLMACAANPGADPQEASTPPAAVDTPVSAQDSSDPDGQGDQIEQALEALRTSLSSFDSLSDLDPPGE